MHELKITSVFYRAIVGGKLSFLLCPNGKFRLHDVIRLIEFDPATGESSGRTCYVQVLFIVADPTLGIRDGYAALSVKVKILSTQVKVPKS